MNFGTNKTPSSYERIKSCDLFFSKLPQAALDKLELVRRNQYIFM